LRQGPFKKTIADLQQASATLPLERARNELLAETELLGIMAPKSIGPENFLSFAIRNSFVQPHHVRVFAAYWMHSAMRVVHSGIRRRLARDSAVCRRSFSGTQQAFDCRSQLSANALQVAELVRVRRVRGRFPRGSILSVERRRTRSRASSEAKAKRGHREISAKYVALRAGIGRISTVLIRYATHFPCRAIVQRIEFLPAG